MKRILVFLLAALLCVLTACAQTTPAPSPTAEGAATQAANATPTPDPNASPTPMPTKPADATPAQQLEVMVAAAIGTTPTVTYVPEKDFNSTVKAVYYTGMDYRNKPTRVFAYVGMPANASPEKPVPAVVLVHGGAGRAFGEWVQAWVNQGYAAIAMDTYGNHPNDDGNWVRDREGGLNIDNLASSQRDIDQQWMYYCVTEAILGGNLLRADQRVNNDKIGIMGISWGGLATSIIIGHDSRFAFAVPMYGCGYLYESETYFEPIMNSAGTRELWEPSLRLSTVKTPTLWITGGADHSFSINSLQKSYADTENGQIAILPNLQHGYFFDANTNKEIYRFADSVCKDGPALVTQSTHPNAGMGKDVSFKLNVPDDVTEITVTGYYTTEWLRYNKSAPGSAIQTPFSTFTAQYDAAAKTVSAKIPENAKLYYFSIAAKSGAKTYLTSSDVVWFD